MTCMDLRETQRTAVLLEKQAGTLRTLSAELEEISRTIKRNETLLQASTSVEKEAGTRLNCPISQDRWEEHWKWLLSMSSRQRSV